MGRRGRVPEPHAVQEAKGWPGKRKPKHPVTPRAMLGDPPLFLDDVAAEKWRALGPTLLRLGLLSEIDQDSFALYCATWSEWRRAIDFITRNGQTYIITDDQGRPKYVATRPEVTIARHALRALLRLNLEFGLTPSGRTRFNIPPQSAGSVHVVERVQSDDSESEDPEDVADRLLTARS